MANTSQRSGEAKFGHKGPLVFGYGKMKNNNQGLPVCNNGNIPAHITANIVIASAARLTPVRHFCLNNKRMAEISVPA